MRPPRIRKRHAAAGICAMLLLVSVSALTSHSRKRPTRRQQQCAFVPRSLSHVQLAASAAAASNEGGNAPVKRKRKTKTYSAKAIYDNGLTIITDEQGKVTARPTDSVKVDVEPEEPPAIIVDGDDDETTIKSSLVDGAIKTLGTAPRKVTKPPVVADLPPRIVPTTGFNVVLTHCTADFDSLASAVGLAILWGRETNDQKRQSKSASTSSFDSASHVPTFVVLPRGAHPAVHRFLALHKHLFPIRSLKSLPADLSNLNRLALVDAQRRDRLGPAEPLLQHAKRITVVDHHIDQDSDIEATDYVVDKVGSVSTMIVEHLKAAVNGAIDLTEAEATLLALGIHADTGSLCFDSTTPRDAMALAWCLEQGASQAAIAEHSHSSLSNEQQGVLTQAMMNANTTRVHGVTLSTVLLSADGFIHGLAAVTQDALELSSSDIFMLALVYEASAGKTKKKRQQQKDESPGLLTRLLSHKDQGKSNVTDASGVMYTEAWRGGEEGLRRKRLRAAFDRIDRDGSGYLDKKEVVAGLASSGMITSGQAISKLIESIDTDNDEKISFEEFVVCADAAEQHQEEENAGKRSLTMTVIGRVKAGMNIRAVKLNKLFEQYGGGGHPKAASTTVRLNDLSEAEGVLQGLVDELVATSLKAQALVGDFMTSPVLSVQPHMTEKQVEELFIRYDVRALPVCDDNNDVIGIVTYKEVAAAKERLWNKEQKRIRRELAAAEKGQDVPVDRKVSEERKLGAPVKAWMLNNVQTVEATKTMAEVELLLFETDVGCIPVVVEGTRQLVGMVTRTDVLRQHRYYPSLHYHNKGFSNALSKRSKAMIELRKYLKRFDVEDDD